MTFGVLEKKSENEEMPILLIPVNHGSCRLGG
jgi:hypothetical protein